MSFKHWLAAFALIGGAAQYVAAETRSTAFGGGEDVILRRLGATDNGLLLLVKNQSGNTEDSGNDRIPLFKLDLAGMSPVNESVLRFQTVRSTPATNTFAAGETLMLYGINDLAAGENFDSATVTWANNPYLTGAGSVTLTRPIADTSANGVNDTLPGITMLGTFTFATPSTAGTIVDFSSPALTSFLQADSNDVATFMVTGSQTNAANTSILSNSETGTEGGFPPPTLRTNTDVVNTDFVAPVGTGLEDFHIIRNNYLTGTTFAQGDANFDGLVNQVDFFRWRTAFLAGGGSLEGLNLAIPEPSAAAMILVVATATFIKRRRDRGGVTRD